MPRRNHSMPRSKPSEHSLEVSLTLSSSSSDFLKSMAKISSSPEIRTDPFSHALHGMERRKTKKSCQQQDPFQNINPNITLEIKSFRTEFQFFGFKIVVRLICYSTYRKP